MDDQDFRHLVRRMRQAQRAWFKHHLQADLELSKRLERQVDDALDVSQQLLFEERAQPEKGAT